MLSAHILAPEGADSILTAAMAIRQDLTADDLADTIFPNLTTVESRKVEGVKLGTLGIAKDMVKLTCFAG